MSEVELSPLECDILRLFFELYKSLGFPDLRDIKVLSRYNTGAGRYVYLAPDALIQCEDQFLDMNGAYIEMEGVKYGLMAVVAVTDRKMENLEIVTYGDCGWDGHERPWKMV